MAKRPVEPGEKYPVTYLYDSNGELTHQVGGIVYPLDGGDPYYDSTVVIEHALLNEAAGNTTDLRADLRERLM